MDSLLSSSDISSSKATGFASGLLSSLTSLFGTNPENSGIFAGLLAEQGSISVPPPPPQPDTLATPQNIAPQNDDSSNNSSSTDPASAGALVSLISTLHGIITKLNQQTENATSSNGSSTGSTVQTQSTADVSSSSDTSTSDDSSGDSTDSGTPTTLSGLLSELTALMKYVEKKLQAAGGASATDNTSDNSSANTSTSDPLTQLLSLIQLIQKQLTTSTSGGLSAVPASGSITSSSSAGNATSSVTAALQDLLQIQKDLKGLLASFQSHSSNDTSTATATAAATSSNSAPETATNSLLDLDTADENSSSKPSLAAADSVFDLFGNLFANPFNNTSNTPVVLPVNVNALIDGANTPGGSPDTTGQNNSSLLSDNGSANLNALNTSATAFSSASDGTTSLNPYSFASQLSAARATNGGTTGLPDAVEQVLLQINRGVKSGNDQMTIQLQPAELGKINVKLDISSDGKVSGTIVATNPSTLSMLHKDVRSLERALQEAGLRADPGSLQFSLGGQNGNQTNQAGDDPSSTSSDSASSSGTANASGDIPVDADEIYYITPGRVNLKV